MFYNDLLFIVRSNDLESRLPFGYNVLRKTLIIQETDLNGFVSIQILPANRLTRLSVNQTKETLDNIYLRDQNYLDPP